MEILREVNLKSMSKAECQKTKPFKIEDGMFCAKQATAGKLADACEVRTVC